MNVLLIKKQNFHWGRTHQRYNIVCGDNDNSIINNFFVSKIKQWSVVSFFSNTTNNLSFAEKQTSAAASGGGGTSSADDSSSTISENWSQHEQTRRDLLFRFVLC